MQRISDFVKLIRIVVLLLCASASSVEAQWTCSGPTQAIQWDGTGLICATITPNPYPTPTPEPTPTPPPGSVTASVMAPTSTFVSANTSWTDIAGLSLSLEPQTAYAWNCDLIVTSEATTTAIHLSVNGPASPVSLGYTVEINNTTNAWHTSYHVGYDEVANPSTSPGVINAAKIAGSIENGANSGPLTMRLKSEVGGSSVGVLRNSTCSFTKLGPVIVSQNPTPGLALAAVGDSKTLGPGFSTGYRRELAELLGTAYVGAYPVGGLTTQELRDEIDVWLPTVPQPPDFVLLNIGTNDLTVLPPTFQTNLEYVVDAIHAAWGYAKILIANPWFRNRDTNADTMAVMIAAVVAGRPSFCAPGPDERIYLKWTDNGMSRTMDGTHPNAWGYHMTALEWLAVIGTTSLK